MTVHEHTTQCTSAPVPHVPLHILLHLYEQTLTSTNFLERTSVEYGQVAEGVSCRRPPSTKQLFGNTSLYTLHEALPDFGSRLHQLPFSGVD